MADKQDALPGAFALPGWQVVEATGIDAAAFLQAQTMNDVRALAPGLWQWNGWLNPKGRVIALFGLAKLDAERFWLILPDFPASELANRLQRFVFRSKLKLAAREDCAASGVFVAPERAQGAAFDRATEIDRECITFDLGAEGGSRTLRIVSGHAPASDQHHAALSQDAQRWIAFDLAHGLPRLTMDQSEVWTPQMLSLDRLAAYSLKKGCYPGQEIVARTHYLGQAKRALVRVVGGSLAPGGEISAAGQSIGTLVSQAGTEALAVVAADRLGDVWESNGTPCRSGRLLDGLRR